VHVLELHVALHRRGLLPLLGEGVDGGHALGQLHDLIGSPASLHESRDRRLHHPEPLGADLQAKHCDEEVRAVETALLDAVEVIGPPAVELLSVDPHLGVLQLPRNDGTPVPQPQRHHQVPRREQEPVGEPDLEALGHPRLARRLEVGSILLSLDVLHAKRGDGAHLGECL